MTQFIQSSLWNAIYLPWNSYPLKITRCCDLPLLNGLCHHPVMLATQIQNSLVKSCTNRWCIHVCVLLLPGFSTCFTQCAGFDAKHPMAVAQAARDSTPSANASTPGGAFGRDGSQRQIPMGLVIDSMGLVWIIFYLWNCFGDHCGLRDLGKLMDWIDGLMGLEYWVIDC